MAEGGLRELHALHRQLHDVQQQLKRGPQQIRVRVQHVAKQTAELKELNEKLRELKQLSATKNGDLQVKESRIVDLGAKLNAANSNQEYEVFKRQIAADTAAREVLETEILDALERIDQQELAIKDAEKALGEAQSEEHRIREEVAKAEPGLLARQTQLEADLKQAEKIIPARLMDQYRRIVQAHGAETLSAIENKTCTVCFTQLAPQVLVQVNTGSFVLCKACGRLLYNP